MIGKHMTFKCCGKTRRGNYCPVCGKILGGLAPIPKCSCEKADSYKNPEFFCNDCRGQIPAPDPLGGQPPGQSGYNIYPVDQHRDPSVDPQDWDRNAYYHTDGKRYVYGTGGPLG